jgi:hypothetical protein
MARVDVCGAQTWRVGYRRKDATIDAMNGLIAKTSGP